MVFPGQPCRDIQPFKKNQATERGGCNGMVCNRSVGKRKRCTVIKVREINEEIVREAVKETPFSIYD
jgi:hypothetical protein